MANISALKSELRTQMRRELSRTAKSWLSVANQAVIANLQKFLENMEADVLAWRAHFYGEVLLIGLQQYSLDFYYPRVVVDKQLDFFKGNGFIADGPKGILQPMARASTRLPPKSSRPLICLLPGLAFDRFGNRMGRGGGMYDRFVCQNMGREVFVKVGVCWSFQIIDQVYAEAHDQKVDYIVSEIGIEKIG
jgi:5-formyltetrahydrofolate cyclo-ligase